jgi:hypothetical protein
MTFGKPCALGALALLLGCASHAAEPKRLGAKVESPATSTVAAGPPTRPSAVPTPATSSPATLLVTDRPVLSALEQQGLALTTLMGGDSAADNLALSRLPRFAPLLQELERELGRAATSDKLAGVDVARFPHRLFDRRFLRMSQAHFELAGVVNRPDRAAFDRSSCGETRLIYRLAYALDAERASKLPMTLGIELKVPRTSASCRVEAARWLEPIASDAEARARWLRSGAGPLAPALTRVSKTGARVVVNLQLVRWPSTVRPDLGGHAEYLLRAFRPNGEAEGVLTPERLENTIAPDELAAPARRQALLSWLNDNAASVDAGTPLLPEAMLATRALSVTPRGLHRFTNRPFSVALSEMSFAERDFSSGVFVKSAQGLLRRLDQLSCPGCHQARSVAGFHLLGEDAPDAPAENALALAVSPHVMADLPRRARIARELLAGAEADARAPFAERASDAGGYGEPCGLGNDPTFASWLCQTGLRCSAIEAGSGAGVGQCLPERPEVGDACESGAVTTRADRLLDRMSGVRVESCGALVCNRSRVGFPGGMCTATCETPGASCGSIAILDTFNACLARGDSFLSCIRGNVRPAGLRPCDAQHACRDDYVCARAARGGVCLPPYFVFQLRVDGHSSSLR